MHLTVDESTRFFAARNAAKLVRRLLTPLGNPALPALQNYDNGLRFDADRIDEETRAAWDLYQLLTQEVVGPDPVTEREVELFIAHIGDNVRRRRHRG